MAAYFQYQAVAKPLVPIVNPAAPDRAWAPTYPDRIDPLVSLQPSAQRFYVSTSLVFQNPDQLGPWRPIIPLIIWPRTSIATGAQRTYTSTIEPIVNPPAPTPIATWAPRYPDTVPGPTTRRHLYPSYVSGAPFLGTALRARAFYPDWLPRPRLRLSFQTFEIGGVLNVPKTGGWRPTYPSAVFRPMLRPQGGLAYVTPPSVLLDAAPCVELGDEMLTNPILAEETLTNPTFAHEILTLPMLGAENLC